MCHKHVALCEDCRWINAEKDVKRSSYVSVDNELAPIDISSTGELGDS